MFLFEVFSTRNCIAKGYIRYFLPLVLAKINSLFLEMTNLHVIMGNSKQFKRIWTNQKGMVFENMEKMVNALCFFEGNPLILVCTTQSRFLSTMKKKLVTSIFFFSTMFSTHHKRNFNFSVTFMLCLQMLSIRFSPKRFNSFPKQALVFYESAVQVF